MLRRLILSLAIMLVPMLGMTSHGFATTAQPLRAVQVDLDYVQDNDTAQEEKNINALVERIRGLGVNAVFLQAFSNLEGDGLARTLYFPNHAGLPVREELFNRVVTALKNQDSVKVFGWLPVLSFNLDQKLPRVLAWNEKTDVIERDAKAYARLSPFDAKVRKAVIGIYEDMAASAPIDGLLFHDDALLSDFEDASAPALAAYKKDGLPASIKLIRAKPKLMSKWTKYKTESLIAFTHELADHVRKTRPELVTVRNIYAPVALNPESQEWFAQNYDRFLKAYDYTAVEAMPNMENVPADQASAWMQQLVVVAASRPDGLQRTFFELQSVDWRKQAQGAERAIPTENLAAQMRYLAQQEALNFGYYPDDFVTNTPDVAILQKDFSLQPSMYAP